MKLKAKLGCTSERLLNDDNNKAEAVVEEASHFK